MPLLVILSIEVHLAEWNGDRFSKNQIRKKKIVPDPKNIENRDGGQDRFDKRQNDQHKALQNAAAVKQRSLFQFSRDGGYKAPDQKNRNRTLQPAINQDQSPYMPSHMQIPRCRQQGNHDRVKGYKHRGKKQQHEACRPAGFPFCKRVGECPGITVQEAQKYAGTDSGELNMVFQFEHTSLTDGKYGKWSADRTDLVKLKEVLNRWQNGLRETSWNCLFWGNHDQPRAVSKFGCDLPEYRVLSAKMLCACLYLMQGTPYIYQGEEIGMPNPHFTSLEQYRDIESICAYHDFVDSGVVEKRMMLTLLAHTSRDNARTPMQWNSRFCAGFSSAPPWISLGYSWRAVNVEQEEKDENSVLHFYRDILAFRKGNPLIRYGTFELLCADDPHIFAYVRTYQGKRLLVICNFSEKSQNAAAIYPNPEAIRFHNYPSITPAVLRPFELIAAL